MRQIAIARKNWFFCGSVAGGERNASFMTLVSSEHRNDLDVQAYVNDVLKRLLAVSIDTSMWNNRPFPLRDWILTDEQYLLANWNLVFVHAECTKCTNLIHTVIRELEHREFAANVLIVSVSDQLPVDLIGFQIDNASNARLSAKYEWVMQTPILVRLDSGIVTHVVHSEASIVNDLFEDLPDRFVSKLNQLGTQQ